MMMAGDVDLGHLEIVHFYLFGGVKFLHLLLILMILDIITGVFKAIKNGNLWSRKSLFGYSRKMLVLIVIIVANIMDQILNLDGALVFSTVLFYIANEILSIVENMAELGVLVPAVVADKLRIIEEQKPYQETFSDEIREEMTGSKVDIQLKEKSDDK